MGLNNSELIVVISTLTFMLLIISVTSLIAFKYWGPGGIVEKEQEKYK